MYTIKSNKVSELFGPFTVIQTKEWTEVGNNKKIVSLRFGTMLRPSDKEVIEEVGCFYSILNDKTGEYDLQKNALIIPIHEVPHTAIELCSFLKGITISCNKAHLHEEMASGSEGNNGSTYVYGQDERNEHIVEECIVIKNSYYTDRYYDIRRCRVTSGSDVGSKFIYLGTRAPDSKGSKPRWMRTFFFVSCLDIQAVVAAMWKVAVLY